MKTIHLIFVLLVFVPLRAFSQQIIPSSTYTTTDYKLPQIPDSQEIAHILLNSTNDKFALVYGPVGQNYDHRGIAFEDGTQLAFDAFYGKYPNHYDSSPPETYPLYPQALHYREDKIFLSYDEPYYTDMKSTIRKFRLSDGRLDTLESQVAISYEGGPGPEWMWKEPGFYLPGEVNGIFSNQGNVIAWMDLDCFKQEKKFFCTQRMVVFNDLSQDTLIDRLLADTTELRPFFYKGRIYLFGNRLLSYGPFFDQNTYGVICYDLDNGGEEIWRTQSPRFPKERFISLARPIFLDKSQGQFLLHNRRGILAIGTEDGEKKWEVDITSQFHDSLHQHYVLKRTLLEGGESMLLAGQFYRTYGGKAEYEKIFLFKIDAHGKLLLQIPIEGKHRLFELREAENGVELITENLWRRYQWK